MTKREIIQALCEGKAPPYVPWHMSFTMEAHDKLVAHFGAERLEEALDNHILGLGSDIGFFEPLGNDRFKDVFGAVWNREVDKDIGIVESYPLKGANLAGYTFPNPRDARFFADAEAKIAAYPDRFRIFYIGFSLFERAWTMRGMENLLMDFYDNPEFAHELLETIADYDIEQALEACRYDIDAVYFGDDWGQQHGLIMGPALWKEFIYPALRRMYGAVRKAGKYVFIHSCGDVDELFDDLIGIGLNCFNPFQPEVMDVRELLARYRGRLVFHGGMSTQHTLPFGTLDDVRRETASLLELGRGGGYIFSPAHSVEGDVPLDNMLAMIDLVRDQRN
jgi:uroporphyrinogen decarboxylase